MTSVPCFIVYSKAKLAFFSRYLLTSYFCIPIRYNEKNIFWVLVLEGLVGLHRTVQLQLLQHYWLGYKLGLLWYWMACLGNEQRPFCHFWDCIQVHPSIHQQNYFRRWNFILCNSSANFLWWIFLLITVIDSNAPRYESAYLKKEKINTKEKKELYRHQLWDMICYQ